ncbi:MAG: hypothetical protein M0R66_06965 [Candidatus Omnitrophica bacterium]|nr:hypothetical protein [Candidatus Omnitrophota bacterium]
MHDFSVTRFARLTGWDAMSRKMAFGFHVLGSFICATHFDSADGEARASNLAQVIEHVRRYGRDRPAIIVGDLNICELAGSALCAEYVAAREALAADGFADAYRAVWTDAAAYPGYTVDAARNEIARHFGGGLARLDYFWTRGYDLRAIPYLIKLALTEDGSVGAFARATTPLACAMEGTPPAESCAVERVDGGASDARDLRSAQSDVHAIALSDHYPISLVVDSL